MTPSIRILYTPTAMRRSLVGGICVVLIVGCGDLDEGTVPDELECRSSSSCETGETCAILLQDANKHFDTSGEGLTGEGRCNLVLAGRCEVGRLLDGCWCYFGPHFLGVPDDQRGHLVCADRRRDAGVVD